MNLKKIKDSLKLNKVPRKVADSLQEGDVYNDGTYSGKVISVDNDSITIESQDEDGDVVNVQIPIDDALSEGDEEPTEDDAWEGVVDMDVILAELEPVTGFIDSYEDDIENSGILSIQLDKTLSEEDVDYLENRGYIFLDNEAPIEPGWVDIYIDPKPLEGKY